MPFEESQYHSYELECLGTHFVIKTDRNRLNILANKRDLNSQIGRWFVKLLEFDYVNEYQKGANNDVAKSCG